MGLSELLLLEKFVRVGMTSEKFVSLRLLLKVLVSLGLLLEQLVLGLVFRELRTRELTATLGPRRE